jgi:glycosyltransferase domain-containing protein
MISILIPTINRPDFVVRALRYYAAVGFGGCVCLGDSSAEAEANRIRQEIDVLKGRLNICYRYYPTSEYKGNARVVQDLCDAATTPFVAYAGDDDFLIPNTLEKCVAFLDAHPDYSAANGVSVVAYLKSGGAHGTLGSVEYMGAHKLLSDRATERWKGYMRQPLSTQYYVHRKETWQRMYRDVPAAPLRYIGEEMLPCSISAIAGKITELEGLGCVFQVNDRKEFGWSTHSMYELIMSPLWTRSARAVRASIVEYLVQQDHLTEQAALKFFDQEFWRHLLFMLEWHYSIHHAEPLNVYDALKRKRWLVNTYLFLKRVKAGRQHRWISLQGLLDPSDPMHDDFMPVQRAITGV